MQIGRVTLTNGDSPNKWTVNKRREPDASGLEISILVLYPKQRNGGLAMCWCRGRAKEEFGRFRGVGLRLGF